MIFDLFFQRRLSKDTSIDSQENVDPRTRLRRLNMPLMYQMYESQVDTFTMMHFII